MKILAIDTSAKNCSVAITEDEEKIIELHSNDEKTHSVKLMPMIDEAFQKSNLTLNDMDLLACCLGPGSFTGVRIGISTIKAFTDVTNIPVVGVSSLEGLAYNAIDNLSSNIMISSTFYCSIIDAKNDNVYCGLYRYYNNCLNQVTDLIAEECIKLGIIKEKKEVSKYYWHSIGHNLGLDTHDSEPQGRNFVFDEGMVFTVEPGIYIGEEGIGIRIEDDVLVTADGCKVLTKDMIKEVKDIEEFMKNN